MSDFNSRLKRLEDNAERLFGPRPEAGLNQLSDTTLKARLAAYPPEALTLADRLDSDDRRAALEHRLRDISEEGLDILEELSTKYFDLPAFADLLAESWDRELKD